MAEMFTMQRYLQMGTLRRNGLQHFDSWAGTFGETASAMELSPDGAGYRLQSRFARFVNVPELMQQFRQVADVQTAEMLKLPIPKMDTGGPITVSAPATPELKRFVGKLVKRTEKIKNGKVDPREDNMLKITTEGRKAALDLRLVMGGVRESPDSKVNLAVEKIHQVWQDSSERRGAQLVFCDMSTPRPGGNAFSVYDDVREKLLARGVPPLEIAFIQDHDEDAAKATLFKSVREGKVRILLGSTPKMGEGTNVQRRLVALHHLDAPWRPADIEQRDGRILRQGNTNEYVKVFRYVTEGSFDAYMWQTLETKCRFIAQVMTGDATMRRAEDVDAAALTYAEVKAIASGNPLVIEKATIDAEVLRLTRLKKQHADSQYQMRCRVKTLGENARMAEREIEALHEDLRARTSTKGDEFTMTVQKETLTLHREIAAKTEQLKALKTRLVGHARSCAGELEQTDSGGRRWTAKGSDGSIARVNFPAPALVPEVEAHGDKLKQAQTLAGEAFRRLFAPVKIYQLADDFRALAVALLAPRKAEALIALLETESSPRVSFEAAKRTTEVPA
jgi:hypothetical protein